MALDPVLADVITANSVHALRRLQDDSDHASARQRDGAAYDMRMVQGFITGELFASNDPEQFAGLNTAIRVPSTLSHPSMLGPGVKE